MLLYLKPLHFPGRVVVQSKVLTAPGIYIYEGGIILETPAGDVYFTQEQAKWVFDIGEM